MLLGDDLIDETETLLQQMIAARGRYGGSVVALMEVPRDQINLYGCAAVEALDGEDDVVRVTSMVEKPDLPRRPRTSRSSGATCSTRRSSRCWSRRRPDVAARSS